MNFNEKLLLAVGEIDDELIAKAEGYRARPYAALRRNLSIAACLLIVSIGVVGAFRLFGPKFDMAGGNMAPGAAGDKEENYMDGAMTNDSYGSVEIVSREGGSRFTVYITLYEQVERHDVIFRGSGTDQYGEPIFIISTTADYAELTHIPVAPPVLKVNGNVATTLPTEPGSYTVEIDVSHVVEAGYDLDDYFVLGIFGQIPRY